MRTVSSGCEIISPIEATFSDEARLTFASHHVGNVCNDDGNGNDIATN